MPRLNALHLLGNLRDLRRVAQRLLAKWQADPGDAPEALIRYALAGLQPRSHDREADARRIALEYGRGGALPEGPLCVRSFLVDIKRWLGEQLKGRERRLLVGGYPDKSTLTRWREGRDEDNPRSRNTHRGEESSHA